ncbi:MAG: hypothetical protein OEZ13_00550 [Spirochaetia bacterium]|nr:hypothetical protein [Spirochaetia bacterium]
MLKFYKLFVFLIFITTSVVADEIFIKENGKEKIIKGKVIKVTNDNIEYDPEGDIPFNMVERIKVVKIVYHTQETVYFNKDKDVSSAINASDKWLAIEFESGYNGFTGLFGLRTDFHLFGPISLNLGMGAGLWGARLSTALRYYFNYPFNSAICIGASYNSGAKDGIEDYETASGTVEKVTMDLTPVTVINFSYLYNFKISRSVRFQLEIGYGHPLKKGDYTIKNEMVLSDKAKEQLKKRQPGGGMLSLAFAFLI